MTTFDNNKMIPFLVIIGGSILLLISFGLRHSFGLYLLPITEHLGTGRELFAFASALNVLMIGIGSPLFGAFSDKYGSGKASILGIILVILSLFWMAYVNSPFGIIFRVCSKKNKAYSGRINRVSNNVFQTINFMRSC